MLLLSFILACGDKVTDTALSIDTETDTAAALDTADSNTEDSDIEDDNTSDSGDSNTPDQGDGSNPIVGAWTVNGPEFTTNTCGGGESFPNSRSLTLALDGGVLSMFIEEPGERSYHFNCTLTGAAFLCEDIVVENVGPQGSFTLYYTHQLQGVFSDNHTLVGDYELHTTCTGGASCSESNLGFATPCEQLGTMTATLDM